MKFKLVRMLRAILFTHSVLNFFFIYHECDINYLKSYHGILKFQLDDTEQKNGNVKSYFTAHQKRYQQFHDNNRTILLDLTYFEHHEQ